MKTRRDERHEPFNNTCRPNKEQCAIFTPTLHRRQARLGRRVMVSQNGVKIAVYLITKHFGNLVAQVCECLLQRGPLTIANIVRYTELSPTQVKNSLLVLIQHNCVQAFILDDPGGFGDAKLITQYLVLFDNILHRLRFSKFLALLSPNFDKPCLELLEGLLQHGRLTLKQMFDRTRQTEGNNVALTTVQENLQKLVMARYVERCPVPEPLIEPSEEAAPGRRGAKSNKIVIEPETLQQRIVAASIPMEALRFSFSATPDVNKDDKNNSATEGVGAKRKLDELESDGRVTDEQVILWRANYEEFIRQLRHKACIENVRARLDGEATTVFSAMLEASKGEEKRIKIENSVSLSVNSIYEEVIKSEKGRNMTFDHVRASLVQLSSQPHFVRVVDESYSVDFKNIIELAQNDEVESVALKRYGRDAYRIFRLLSKAGHLLETDKISDTIFVEKKQTINMLYKLWQDGYLHMEKLFAGMNQFLLWKINKQNLWEHVLDEMFHAALNLSQRVTYELDQHEEILKLPPDRREGPNKDKYERLRKVRLLMESSLMKLDDAIMLFHDF